MKSFNLQEYLKNPSQKVVTRDGREVRILCTDRISEFPIIALVFDTTQQEEVVVTFQKDGKYAQREEQPLDLFFVPTKREGWVNIYKRMIKCSYIEESIYSSKEIAIKNKFGDSYVTTTKIEWEESLLTIRVNKSMTIST